MRRRFSGRGGKRDHISHPKAKDYRRYGEERREEALKATATLGIKAHDVIFLSYPDGGLSYLRFKFRAHPFAYRSPFTRVNHPPISECIIPHCDYTGHDLSREIERVIARFRPNLVATTPADDWHPDHNATYFFVKEALRHLNGKHPKIKPHVLTFLIHFEQWPVDQGSGAGAHLNPPDGFLWKAENGSHFRLNLRKWTLNAKPSWNIILRCSSWAGFLSASPSPTNFICRRLKNR